MAKDINQNVNVRLNFLKGIDQFKELPKSIQKTLALSESKTRAYANRMATLQSRQQALEGNMAVNRAAILGRAQAQIEARNLKGAKAQEILAIKRKGLAKISEEVGASVYDTSRALGFYGYRIGETGEVIDLIGEKQELTRKQFLKAQAGLKRFRGELLSVMFAGMALTRSLNGIISAQMELWGVTELTSAAWQVTMLPIMAQFAPFLYKVLDGFMNLPEPVQKGVGALIGFGYI